MSGMTDEPSQTPPATQSDAETLRKAQAGDRSAFALIVTTWQDRIYNAMRKITGNADDAADLTQETFTRALGNLGSFRGDSSVYTWLFRIAVNLSMTRARQVKRRRTFLAGGLFGGAAADDDSQSSFFDRREDPKADPPPAAVESKERRRMVLQALQRLDEQQRSLLVMRDIEGMDYQQIADLLALPLGTMKSRLFRARMALRDELKGYLDLV